MEYPIAGLITAIVVMLTALLFKRSNPVFWGVIAILLFIMFMGLFVLGASVAARRWMDSGDGEIVLAVLAGVVTAGTSVIAMITQKKRRANSARVVPIGGLGSVTAAGPRMPKINWTSLPILRRPVNHRHSASWREPSRRPVRRNRRLRLPPVKRRL